MGIVFMFHRPFKKKNNNESITFYWFFILLCVCYSCTKDELVQSDEEVAKVNQSQKKKIFRT